MRRRVFGGSAQMIEIGLACRWIFLLKTFFISDGLLLHVFDIHRASDSVVTVEVAVRAFAVLYSRQNSRQMRGIVNTAIEP